MLEWAAIFPSSGDLSDPETEPVSPTLQADSLPSELPVSPHTEKKKDAGDGTALKKNTPGGGERAMQLLF